MPPVELSLQQMDPHHYIACDRRRRERTRDAGTASRMGASRSRRFTDSRAPWCAVWLFALGRPANLRGAKDGSFYRFKRNLPILGISAHSWGVDYVLINAVHPMISPPFHYRDGRTASTLDKVRETVGLKLIFEETCISIYAYQHDLSSFLGYRTAL